MLTISKPLSAGQAQAYHSKEFTSAEQTYYSQQGQVHGKWHGKLAEEWGLRGEVTEEQFTRLANGQHPETAEPLVRHRESFEYQNERGETVKTMESPRRLGCNLQRPQKRLSHCACRWRRTGPRGSLRERRHCPGRTGTLCTGSHRRKQPRRDHRQVGRRQVRARQRPPR